jgi:HPr kinase/phosphorylase
MGNGKRSSLYVYDFFRKTEEALKLRAVLGKTGFKREINPASFQKKIWPIQIWGKKEIKRLKSLPEKRKKSFLEESINKNTACVILTEGLAFYPETMTEAKKEELALFESQLKRKKCREQVKRFFTSSFLRLSLIPGGLLSIFGLGVLITGDSGIGKSESALELISRGHRFVSDDVTQLRKTTAGKLMGQSPPLSRYFMEIRGLGIINIKEIFGERRICRNSGLDLIINLKAWEKGRDYDRLGLRFPEDRNILGQKVPQINIPVGPGRNIATLIEIACKVHILRKKGYFAPLELTAKIRRALTV